MLNEAQKRKIIDLASKMGKEYFARLEGEPDDIETQAATAIEYWRHEYGAPYGRLWHVVKDNDYVEAVTLWQAIYCGAALSAKFEHLALFE